MRDSLSRSMILPTTKMDNGTFQRRCTSQTFRSFGTHSSLASTAEEKATFIMILFVPIPRIVSRKLASQAAVHHQVYAGNIAGLVTGKKQRCIGHIPGIAHFLHRARLVAQLDHCFNVDPSVAA